ncbi:MAG: TRAP transporter substrate-binding protein DctP, partial [Lachnospiraceae bacterium]|nr:TRAP transporter substrate-binding protein DctP [Lachnospiraceae bacterium]
SDETYTLIVSTPRTGWIADWYDEFFADLEEKSGGRLQFQVNQNNEIGNPSDCVTMFEAGTIDFLDMNVSASGANMPVSDLVHVPYYCDDPATAADIMWALYDAGYMTEYDGYHVLMYIPTDMMMVASTKELATLDDFSGLKVRASSPMILSALELCGGTSVSIEASEVYMALSQGTIDASVSSPLYMVLSAYEEVCDYLLNMPICTGMCYLAVNEDSWNALPTDLQELITEETATYYDLYIETLYENTDAYMEQLAEGGMTIVEPSEELESEIIELTSGLLDEYKESLTSQGYDADAILEIADGVMAAE